MKNKDFIEGFRILSAYLQDDYRSISPGHDQIWIGSVSMVTEDEAKTLKGLGWFEDEGSWSCFL